MWRLDELVQAAAASLEAHEREATLEQAVRGLDALAEVELHPVLAGGFESAGMGVVSEQPYPSDRRPRRKRSTDSDMIARDSERRRCDLVLLPAGSVRLVDPTEAHRDLAAERRRAEGTLFERAAPTEPPAIGEGAVEPEDAFWLEVKVVGQYCYECGVPGPNTSYASQLVRSTVTDLAKLGADPRILNAALLLVHFTADEAVAEHDELVLSHKCLDKGVVADLPIRRRLAITDRIGNAVCSVVALRPRRTE